jgi:hypothetical protein
MADEDKPKPTTNGAADPRAAAAKLAEAESPEASGTPRQPRSSSREPERHTDSERESSRSVAPKRPSGKSPWPSAHKDEGPPPASIAPAAAAVVTKADWGEPLARLDRAWTKLETRLAAFVLLAEVATLVFWIAIRALSSTGTGGGGMIFRAISGALVVGLGAWFATKSKLGPKMREKITTVAVLVGFFAGTRLGDAGIPYFANFFAWLQNSSVLVFVGGVGELARRLTLWLALLGASLATAQGKHINLDVLMRFLSPRARVPVAVLGWVASAVVAISASWGFFDFVAVEELRAPPTVACPGPPPADGPAKRCPAPPGMKIDTVLKAAGQGLFITTRQLSLDVRSLPRVVAGTPYNKWLTPHTWNEWVRGGGWESHFDAADVKAMELPEDGTIDYREPAVTAIPGSMRDVPGWLVPLFNLVFAFGLLVIGIRFLLRSALAAAGWIKVDPAATHGDDELAHAHDPSPAAELAEAAIKGTHT